MQLALAVFILAIVFLVYHFSRRARFYREFFADPHLRAVAAALPELRQVALPGATVSTVTSPQTVEPKPLVSPLGLVVVYTVRGDREADRFIHHVSVSLAGGYTPHGVGAYFLLFALRGLGVDARRARCGMSKSHIFHAEWTLPAAEHAEFAGREVPPLADPRAVWSECVQLRPQLKFEGIR